MIGANTLMLGCLKFISLLIWFVFCSIESGGGWTRTTERIPGQIYSLLQLPLCDSPEVKELVFFLTLQKYIFFLYL